MKKLFIVANWKSNKTEIEAKEWINGFKIHDLRFTNKEIIICPSFTLLSILKSYISCLVKRVNHKFPIKLGAQDVSPFDKGAYTGEVYGEQIKEFADYVIIGHSERRKYFNEDDELLAKKVLIANKFNLTPIFCVQGENSTVPKEVTIVAYEPVFAIGTGKPDTPENAEKVVKKIRENNPQVKNVLYGGSVTSKNVQNFTKMENIDGVLVGSASFDPSSFLEIIKNA